MWSRSISVPFYLGVSLSFFLCLDFIAISDCVFNNKNHYVLGHTGYQIIITILVISTLNANLRVATRVYDVEGGAIFSKNSTFVFFDGAAWTPRLRSPSPIMAPGFIHTIFKETFKVHTKDNKVLVHLRGQYTWMPFFPSFSAFFPNFLHEISFNRKMLS